MRPIAPELQADLIAQGLVPESRKCRARSAALLAAISDCGADGAGISRLATALGWSREKTKYALRWQMRCGRIARLERGLYVAQSEPLKERL